MILVFGTICLDRVRRIERFPEVGSYCEVQDEALLLGGEAANTSSVLRQWGADYMLFGNGIGEGPWGDLLRERLMAQGLRVASNLESPGEAPVCDIYVSQDGHRTMFGLGFKHLDKMIDLSQLPFVAGGWLTLDSNFGETSRQLVRAAHSAGMNVYAMDLYRNDEPLRVGDFWQGSTDVVGQRGDPNANRAWVRGWIARYGCSTVLTDGPNGLVFGSPQHEPMFYPSFLDVEVVDSTGAGDAFRAGMLFGLDSGWDLDRTIRFAMASGALSCRSLGGSTSGASLAELESTVRSSGAD